jgi:hypothetical protein
MSVLSIALAMITSLHPFTCLNVSRWLETTVLMHRFEYGRLVSSHRQEWIDLSTHCKVSVAASKGYGSALQLVWGLEYAL